MSSSRLISEALFLAGGLSAVADCGTATPTKACDGDGLERKVRVLVRGPGRAQRMDLLAVHTRLRPGQQTKGLRELLRA